jgi:hypothetical protein
VDARVAGQRAHVLEVVVLFQCLHRHTMPEIVWLQLRTADDAATAFDELLVQDVLRVVPKRGHRRCRRNRGHSRQRRGSARSSG